MNRQEAIKHLQVMLILFQGMAQEMKDKDQEAMFKDHAKALDVAIKAIQEDSKTSSWVLDEKQTHVEKTYHCSRCDWPAWGEHEKTDYCPGCGAKMIKTEMPCSATMTKTEIPEYPCRSCDLMERMACCGCDKEAQWQAKYGKRRKKNA